MTATPETVSAREQAALQEPLQLNSRGMRITIGFFVAIPLLKLGILISILVLTGRSSPAYLRLRTRLYKLVRAIGRWSMIDVFMVTIFVGLLHMGPLSNVSPDSGSLAFATVVVLTMLATEALDPRLMWDVARESSSKELAAT